LRLDSFLTGFLTRLPKNDGLATGKPRQKANTADPLRDAGAMSDHSPRRHSPAAERNRDPILTELMRLLPQRGVMLEVASGTGQHAAHFAQGLGGWRWHPTDADLESQTSIDAWCQGLPNVAPARQLDLLAPDWPAAPAAFDAIFAANLLHISPWRTCAALMRAASARLLPHGLMLVYGPFIVEGQVTAPSNLAFDVDLRQRDPRWGLRRLSDIVEAAHAEGLLLHECVAMPANNLLLVLGRSPL
jgi:hypothetical protein